MTLHILATGTSRGIGLAVAEALAERDSCFAGLEASPSMMGAMIDVRGASYVR